MKQTIACCLAASLLLVATPTPVEAGWISKLVSLFRKEADDDVAKSITKKEAREAATAAGAAGAVAGSAVTVGGLMAAAGLSASPVEAEAKAVEEEIRTAMANGATVYRARTCLHPEKDEFYTVPKWAEFCADGSEPMDGKGITLPRE